MSTPDPFAYPLTPHTPTHAPAGYTEYGRYKQWLRDDFAFRCVYCLTRERWDFSPSGHDGFGVDHVVAQSADPFLVVTYANLVYACNACNSIKSDTPLPGNPLAEGLGAHLIVSEAGIVAALTDEGTEWINTFRLNRPGRVGLRLEKLAVLRAKQLHPDCPVVDKLHRRAFGYPVELPDLSVLRPPGGNALPGSESRSHFARRERGELADVY